MKKYISSLLSILIFAQPLTALAAEPTNISDVPLTRTPRTFGSEVLLIAEPQTFSAIVPTELPVNMDKLGTVTTSDNLVITNNSKGPIVVHDVSVDVRDTEWSIANYSSDFRKFDIGSKVIGLQFNGDDVKGSGSMNLSPDNWPIIDGWTSLRLDYNAKLAAQKSRLTNERPARVTFTLQWHEAGHAELIDSDANAHLVVGTQRILTLNFRNVLAEDDSVVWTSSDESIATVRESGNNLRTSINGSKNCQVTGLSAGVAMITGTLKDGTSATARVSVKDADIIPVGTKYIDGNYEYSYGQYYIGSWQTIFGQNGWGVRILNKNQTDHLSPLTTIQYRPVTNMSGLFEYNPMTTLNLIDWDTSNVTDMRGMFLRSQATSLDLSSFDTSNVTNMSMMFDASKETSLNLSSFDTSKVTDMSMMFRDSQASSLNLNSFDTSKVTDMSFMFDANKAINLDLSKFDTSSVTNMSFMFYESFATNLDLSSFNTSNVKFMDYMFSGSKATNLELTSFDTTNVTDMRQMFSSSDTLALDLSSFTTRNVMKMDNMFAFSKIKSLIAKTQVDSNKYQTTSNFPSGVTVTVKA